jgi:hypothetical protein
MTDYPPTILDNTCLRCGEELIAIGPELKMCSKCTKKTQKQVRRLVAERKTIHGHEGKRKKIKLPGHLFSKK